MPKIYIVFFQWVGGVQQSQNREYVKNTDTSPQSETLPNYRTLRRLLLHRKNNLRRVGDTFTLSATGSDKNRGNADSVDQRMLLAGCKKYKAGKADTRERGKNKTACFALQ